MSKTDALIIKDFQQGVADSPHVGFADMRGIDVSSEKGVTKLNTQLNSLIPAPFTTTFTANSITDTITLANTSFNYRMGFMLTTTGTLPGGLFANTVYTLVPSGSSYKVSPYLGKTIDITSVGTGTHTITLAPPPYIVSSSDAYTDTGIYHHYALDYYGYLWDITPQEMQFVATIQNRAIVVWKYYIFGLGALNVDPSGGDITLYGKIGGAMNSTQLINYWGTFLVPSFPLVATDDTIYFVNFINNRYYIGYIREAAGKTFDPLDATTYVINGQALDLPIGARVTGLVEYGANLMISTTENKIYSWDRVSPSFNSPIITSEPNIRSMVVLNNVLYFSAGNKMKIYATIGSSTKFIRALPDRFSTLSGNENGYNYIRKIITHQGKLLFLAISDVAYGVWSLDVETGVLVMETVLNQSYASRHGTAYIASRNNTDYYFSSNLINATTLGNSVAWHSLSYPTSYTAYLETPFYEVGQYNNLRTFQQLEIKLAKPLIAGEGVRVDSRTNLTDSFQTIVTFEYNAYADNQSRNFPFTASQQQGEFIQFRVYLKGSTTGTYGSTPSLKNIVLL
jgi:hypothetical protein